MFKWAFNILLARFAENALFSRVAWRENKYFWCWTYWMRRKLLESLSIFTKNTCQNVQTIGQWVTNRICVILRIDLRRNGLYCRSDYYDIKIFWLFRIITFARILLEKRKTRLWLIVLNVSVSCYFALTTNIVSKQKLAPAALEHKKRPPVLSRSRNADRARALHIPRL